MPGLYSVLSPTPETGGHGCQISSSHKLVVERCGGQSEKNERLSLIFLISSLTHILCCKGRTRTFTRRLGTAQKLVVNPCTFKYSTLSLFRTPHPRDRGAWLPDFITSQCNALLRFCCHKDRLMWLFIANFSMNIFKIYSIVNILRVLITTGK